jgi:hypothetical protein
MNALIAWESFGDTSFYYVEDMSYVDIEMFDEVDGCCIGDATTSDKEAEIVKLLQTKYCNEGYEDLPRTLNDTLLFKVGYIP